MLNLGELYSYRNMILKMVKRDVRGRYKGSVLGFFWNLILPLVQIFVYVMIFTVIFDTGVENYSVYLISGISIWFWFSESLSEGSGAIVSNADMVKKIFFPREVLIISTVLSKMVNFLIMLGIFFVVILLLGHGISINALLFLPIIIIISFFFILGLCLFLSSVNVYLRDVKYLTDALLMIVLWLTPVLYISSNIDNSFVWFILQANPMTYFVSVFHDILYWKTEPIISTMIICLFLSIASMVVGLFVFRKLEKDFSEAL